MSAISDPRTRPSSIQLRGVRVHNLANLDLQIPLGCFVVLSGVSGSGKSSLAFDTLYAEGQRRYVEGFAVHARRLLPKFDKPDADRIENVPPAIAVAQQLSTGRQRASVAALCGLLNPLRALYAAAATTSCHQCGKPVVRATPQSVLAELQTLPAGMPVTIAFPLSRSADESSAELAKQLGQEGYARVEVAGQVVRLASEPLPPVPLNVPLRVLVDRLQVGSASESRWLDALETAFAAARGCMHAQFDGKWRCYSESLTCTDCGEVFPPPEPALFNWSNRQAVCLCCHGTGRSEGKELARGASPRSDAAEDRPCARCGGQRLRPQVLAHRLLGKSFAEMLAQTVGEAIGLLTHCGDLAVPVRSVLEQIRHRLDYLQKVGLGYLTLDRACETLAMGEARRVALTAALGSGLARTLFVLDEPTAGLHPQDTARLIEAIQTLKAADNTVVVVEHDAQMIRAADQVIDLGPGAGANGGTVVFQGPPADLLGASGSVTAAHLQPRARLPKPVRPPRGLLRLQGACVHNLQNVSVDLPLGCLCVVAGVSGAGKSSLVVDTLYPATANALEDPIACSRHVRATAGRRTTRRSRAAQRPLDRPVGAWQRGNVSEAL